MAPAVHIVQGSFLCLVIGVLLPGDKAMRSQAYEARWYFFAGVLICIGSFTIHSLLIDFVPEEFELLQGQILFTSGAGGLFPPGIAVARIKEVQTVPGELFVKVIAEPVAHWQRDNWLAVASHLHDSESEP